MYDSSLQIQMAATKMSTNPPVISPGECFSLDRSALTAVWTCSYKQK